MEKEKLGQMIDELFDDAYKGKVNVDSTDGTSWKFNIKFFVQQNGQTNAVNKTGPILKISDRAMFEQKLHEYLMVAEKFYATHKAFFEVDDDAYSKLLSAFLFSNATYYDFENPIEFIEKRKQMLMVELKPEVLDFGEFVSKKDAKIKGAELKASVSANPPNLEAPYLFTPYLENDSGEKFMLPGISFAISPDGVYVYSVQTKKQKQTSKFAKTMDRFCRKINDGFDEKTGTKPEDKESIEKEIQEKPFELQVSPTAVCSMTVFLTYMVENGVEKVTSPNYLPVRNASNKVTAFRHKKPDEKVDDVIDRYYRDQFSATNKLAYLFYRHALQFDECVPEFDDYKSQVVMTLGGSSQKTDNIAFDFERTVKEKNVKQKEMQ